MTLVSGALLNIIEEACEGVLTLTEDVEPEDFFSSRLTQQEVIRQIRIIAESAANVPEEVKRKMAEVDWAGWQVLLSQVNTMGGFERDAIWFAVRSMVPATLMWLRVFRNSQPQFFELKP
jgi:uncharacterized protein with HEPN domain